MYIPKTINVSIATTKEKVAAAVNDRAIAIHIPAEYCKDVFGYVKNTAINNTSNKKTGKIATVAGAIGTAIAWTSVSYLGIIAAPLVVIYGACSFISGIDKLNKYDIAFFKDGSVGLFYTGTIDFVHDKFMHATFNNCTFVRASNKTCPLCHKSLPNKFSGGECPKCHYGDLVILYNSKKLAKEMRKNKVKI